jgi:hypothetical protein
MNIIILPNNQTAKTKKESINIKPKTTPSAITSGNNKTPIAESTATANKKTNPTKNACIYLAFFLYT